MDYFDYEKFEEISTNRYDEFVCDSCHSAREGECMQRVEDMWVCEACAAKRFWKCQHCVLLWPNKFRPAVTNRGFTCEECLHLDHSVK